jgi:alpha-glucosidase
MRIIYEAYLPKQKLEEIAKISPKNSGTFNFSALDVAWNAQEYKKYLTEYHEHLHPDATPNQVRGNHDRPRVASPHVLDHWNARALAVINLTLPGNPYIYYGEELALPDVYVPDELLDDKLGFRDYARTPMLWNGEINAGFSGAEQTWLPVDPLYHSRNALLQSGIEDSTLNMYKMLLSLRHSHPGLNHKTSFEILETEGDLMAFIRSAEDSKNAVMTIVNFSEEFLSTSIDTDFVGGRVVISSRNSTERQIKFNHFELAPNEAIVIELG